MIRAIMLKEWVKLRLLITALALFALVLIIILAYQTHTLFLSSEPESLLWHRFVFFDEHPHGFLKITSLCLGFVIALGQFYVERNRGRILVHLPINSWLTLLFHQLIGIGIIGFFGAITSIGIWLVFVYFYPSVLLHVSLFDNLLFLLGGCLSYLGWCALILEPKIKNIPIKAFFVFSILGLLISLNNYDYILLWIFSAFIFVLLGIDSVLAISNKRLYLFYPLFILFFISICWIGGVHLWKNAIPKKAHYYPFYSVVLETFVYQRNLGGHNFEYGTLEGEKMSFARFKTALPFVYWRDLQTQGELPVTINNQKFDANLIKKERLSLSYSPSLLNPPRVELYPLFNPDPNVGIIPFPTNAIYAKKDKLIAFHHHGDINKELTNQLNNALYEHEFSFPIKNIWGKFTNLKPYDLGLFFQDSNNKLYHMLRYGNALHVKPILSPEKLEYLHISENAQKQIAGYGIGESGKFYILLQDGFIFTPLNLNYFDYKKMNLQFLSDPLQYIVRYEDGNDYFIHRFSKDFSPVGFAKFNKNLPPKELL